MYYNNNQIDTLLSLNAEEIIEEFKALHLIDPGNPLENKTINFLNQILGGLFKINGISAVSMEDDLDKDFPTVEFLNHYKHIIDSNGFGLDEIDRGKLISYDYEINENGKTSYCLILAEDNKHYKIDAQKVKYIDVERKAN